MEEQYNVYWQNEIVGEMRLNQPDMWNFDGPFIAHSTETADRFVQMASALDLRQLMRDPRQGFPIFLRSLSEPLVDIHLWVLGVDDEHLYMRLPFRLSAVTIKPWWRFW